MKETDPLMIDLRVSFRALRLFTPFGLLIAASAGLSGCSGESAPAPTAENTPASSAASSDVKKAVAKQAGTKDKGNLMPEFPKK